LKSFISLKAKFIIRQKIILIPHSILMLSKSSLFKETRNSNSDQSEKIKFNSTALDLTIQSKY
jgi:hypothetical protein